MALFHDLKKEIPGLWLLKQDKQVLSELFLSPTRFYGSQDSANLDTVRIFTIMDYSLFISYLHIIIG